MTSAKAILDMYAHSIVIPKNQQTIGYNPKLKRPYFVKAKWRTQANQYQYSKIGYSLDLCLWIPPINSLTLEFDGTLNQNKIWIQETEENIIKYGLDYCKCSHAGNSDYLWLFNIDGCNDLQQRVALAKLLGPKDAKIDMSNISGQTLVPVILHKHWKHGLSHNIIGGKDPLKHNNKLPKECKLEFKAAAVATKPTEKPTFFSFCDGLSNAKLKRILETDFKVQKLLAGNLLNYKSPSEARLALLNCLVAYSLNDQQIHTIMSMSSGLNYQEKKHLQTRELGMARRFVTTKREIYGGI